MKRILIVLVLGAVTVFALFHLSRSRTYQLFGKIIQRVETERKVVALTFDDGPTGAHTGEVLHLLASRDVKATFFLIGRDMTTAPEQTRAIVAAGHELGNHSYTHKRMVFRSPAFIRDEVEKTDALIRAAGHRGPILFRAPYCKKLVGLPWYLARHERVHVTFDVEPESNPRIDARADLITAHVVEEAEPGSIILLHPMYANREESRKAIVPIIDALRARGFEFVTLSELLAAPRRQPA